MSENTEIKLRVEGTRAEGTIKISAKPVAIAIKQMERLSPFVGENFIKERFIKEIQERLGSSFEEECNELLAQKGDSARIHNLKVVDYKVNGDVLEVTFVADAD